MLYLHPSTYNLSFLSHLDYYFFNEVLDQKQKQSGQTCAWTQTTLGWGVSLSSDGSYW